MDIYDIDQLTQNPDNNNLYDFTQKTFQMVINGINYYPYTVQKGEEMRIDLVCQSIYNSTDYVDIILDVNNISNPLNIKEGTNIIYPDPSNIDSLRYTDTSTNTSVLANPSKSTRVDQNRQNYIEQNYSLPPTVLNTPVQQVAINGNQLVIGNGLFNT